MTFPIRYNLFIAFALCLVQISLPAQTAIDKALRTSDVSPAWPGCEPKLADCTNSKLTSFISTHLLIPAEAVAAGVGGLVPVEFVIEKNGKIGEARFIHDPGYGLGNEAVRVIKLMSSQKIKWTPARDNGKKVPFRFMAPVAFNLSAPPRELPAAVMEDVAIQRVYDVVDIMPRYAGCEENKTDSVDCTFRQVLSHIQSNLQYPQQALSMRVEGPVVVDFIIDASGRVTQPTVTRELGHGCDAEALRVISLMPNWIPGVQDGNPVAVRMTIPIMFQIPKEKD